MHQFTLHILCRKKNYALECYDLLFAHQAVAIVGYHIVIIFRKNKLANGLENLNNYFANTNISNYI